MRSSNPLRAVVVCALLAGASAASAATDGKAPFDARRIARPAVVCYVQDVPLVPGASGTRVCDRYLRGKFGRTLPASPAHRGGARAHSAPFYL